MRRLIRSIGVNIALKVAGATLVICAITFAVVYAHLVAQSRQAILTTIDTDIAGLVDIYAAEGQGGLIKRIDDRLLLIPQTGEQPYYLLLDEDRQKLSGNVDEWPELGADVSAVGEIKLADGTAALGRVTRLKGGAYLLIARALTVRNQMLGTVAGLFGLALVLVVFAAFGVGLLAAQALRARLNRINRVFQDVEQGQLSARLTDLTSADEMGHLSLNINAMLERIEGLLAAQRDVTEHIAHETRTPLMRLDASLMVAIEQTRNPEILTELENSRSQIKGLLRLFDALLDIASAKARRGDPQGLSDINLSDVALSLIELYQASAEDAGLTLAHDIDPQVMMRADAMQMSRLMVNLLDNAFKYGTEGGYIGFKLKAGPVIIVEDHGKGIDEAQRSRIFQRFQRAADDQPGHGLGLALVSAIAARHGLRVVAEDAQSDGALKGARFVVLKEPAV